MFPNVKRLIVFDLDGTLAVSKSPIDTDMSLLLSALLRILKVAVISGGDWPQFQHQLLANLDIGDRLKDLSLLPTSGTKFYHYQAGWELLYAETFKDDEREKILSAFQQVIKESEFKIDKIWGDQIEDRGSQITFSALGQEAPIEAKESWDPHLVKRQMMRERLEHLIPEYSIGIGGTTSVDVTRAGIDKAYGIEKLRDTLSISIDEMIFVGDALFPGGNDYPVKEAGAVCIQVRDSNECKRIIETILACLDTDDRLQLRGSVK